MTQVTASVRRRPKLRLVLWTFAALVLAGAAVSVLAGRPVPPLDGQLAVAGLRAPVEILFDRWAVPHVYAADADDAWFAAGYLHARERLWKMELYRRASAGRLSELFGERTLPIDRRFLAFALRRAAAREWASPPPSVHSALERYAAGVNAATGSMSRWTRPLEFQLLGVTPEPWTPVDSLSVGKLMAWRLAENHDGELVRGLLARRIGLAEANTLMGDMPPWAPTILGTLPGPAGVSPGAARGASPALASPGAGLEARFDQNLPPGL